MLKINTTVWSRRYTIIVIVLGLGLFLGTWYSINSWKYSYIGDEWGFYSFAKEIAQGINRPYIFSMFGVFGVNSVFSSYWQAVFLKLFGFSSSSWRLSNAILLIPTTFLLFVWVKEVFDREVALASTIFFASSSFLFGYFKLGYPNAVALPLFLGVLTAVVKVFKSLSYKWSVVCGFLLGLSYYFPFGPLFPFILLGPLIFFLFGKNKPFKFKEVAPRCLTVGLISIALVIPSLGTLPSYISALPSHAFIKPFYSSRWQILINALDTPLLFFREDARFTMHFIYGAYFDKVTQLFIILGALGMIRTLLFGKKTAQTPPAMLFIMYLSTLVVLAIVNPYEYTPPTRGLLFIPFGSVFAGFGLNSLVGYFGSASKIFLLLLYLVLMVTNVYKSEVYVFEKNGANRYAHIIRLLESRPVTVVTTNIGAVDKTIYTVMSAYSIRNELKFVEPADLVCGNINSANVIYALYKSELNSGIIDTLQKCRIHEYTVIGNYTDKI